jgi:hypothetical protein
MGHMSNNDEFSHGTGHKFGVTREFPGSYKSCCGMQIESHPTGGWNVTWPGERSPDEWSNTLRGAKSMAEHHHGEEQ